MSKNGGISISKLKKAVKEHTYRTETVKFIEEFESTEVCFYCDSKLHDKDPNHNRFRTIDHIVPRARKGSNRLKNLLCSCRYCNNLRGDMNFIDFGMASIIAKEYDLDIQTVLDNEVPLRYSNEIKEKLDEYQRYY